MRAAKGHVRDAHVVVVSSVSHFFSQGLALRHAQEEHLRPPADAQDRLRQLKHLVLFVAHGRRLGKDGRRERGRGDFVDCEPSKLQKKDVF